jgi:hypothetical protein
VRFNTNGRHAMLNGLTGAINRVSLHSADPGTTGANEISGGTYARQAVTWDTPSGGTVSNSGVITFDVPAGASVRFVGFWDDQATPVFYGWSLLNGSTTGFGTVDSTGDTITSYGHGLVNDDQVVVVPVNNESLPSGLTAGTSYYVVNAAADTFKLSTTQGGSPVDITSTGELFFQKYVPESFGASGQVNFQAGDLVIDARVLG